MKHAAPMVVMDAYRPAKYLPVAKSFACTALPKSGASKVLSLIFIVWIATFATRPPEVFGCMV